MEPPLQKTGSDPRRPTSDADAVMPDAPGSRPEASPVISATPTLRPEGAPGNRLQEQGRDLTPQEWEDFIRQHGSTMLPPDGEG